MSVLPATNLSIFIVKFPERLLATSVQGVFDYSQT
jgi:hypothetical protein